MAKNTSISLGDHFDQFIAERVKNGRYGSASEVIRAGLRLLEDKEAKLDTLRALIAEGQASGFSDYSLQNIIETLDDKGT